LPDGLFSNQKSQFGEILEGFGKDDVWIFCGHSEYLQPIGVFHGHLVYFEGIWSLFHKLSCTKKNLATLLFRSKT
jgi:hypothetical protein